MSQKKLWDTLFSIGSLLAALSQGYMLGRYIVGFEPGLQARLFAVLSAICVAAAYSLIGASWLIMKTANDLQRQSIRWAKFTLPATCAGLIAVSIVNPLVSNRIFEKWFDTQWLPLLGLLPLITGYLLFRTHVCLQQLPNESDRDCWKPFACTVGVFALSFVGLAYSFFPYVVPDRLTVYEAASAPESLMIIFIGVVVVLPAILAYTAFSYRVFRGKANPLSYY